MTDLTALMTAATSSIGRTTPATLEADVDRGNRAWKRRRRATTGLVGAAAAAAIVTGLAAGTLSAPAHEPSAASARTAPVTLVRYVAAQPQGFVIDRIPEHWRVLRSDSSSLVLGPETDRGRGLAADAADVSGRIVVELDAKESLPESIPGRTLGAGASTTTVFDLLGADGTPDGTLGAFTPARDGRTLAVQIPARLHWTDQQAARFVGGLHVTADAEVSAG